MSLQLNVVLTTQNNNAFVWRDRMIFDPNKTYTIHVWDMPICVVDDETEDYIRNKNGTVKLFNIPNYDYSYICDGIDVDDLWEIDNDT